MTVYGECNVLKYDHSGNLSNFVTRLRKAENACCVSVPEQLAYLQKDLGW
jgi:hypothetical protein